MHPEILTKKQRELLPLVAKFSKKFYLVGETAIALHIGHRRSVDFDLFSSNREFDNRRIKSILEKCFPIEETVVNKSQEFTLMINGIKMTFYNFPYEITRKKKFEEVIRLPDLLTLAAMKAFTLGQRAKWKDYVDLYFILKDFHSIDEINKKGKKLFGAEYNEKLFRTQLAYFDDISYEEKVEFLPGFEVSEKEVKKKLIEHSLE